MRCCGASIKGSDLFLVTVTKTEDGAHGFEKDASRKMTLNDDANQDSVRAFHNALGGFFRNNNIETLFLRGRSGSGQFAGGSVTFKIEGLLQSLDGCAVRILMPQTIAAKAKKHAFMKSAGLFKNQEEAFFAACAGMAE
ncbi:DUF3010 family protein [Lichenifustis flavocetrariae]|uniref:DUF3010 family protein n=1 Tax=Lichenifustis flavocetrariae TaxID=2949735 RepID=A0AA41Z5G2_9HYPH|nr:DUF3010 family protein [Lichenifustis flavocetrariae]MCW6509627.1 DUF3010 family protein [Lichenifustis flavocetrariae]